MSRIAESELILNERRAIYHLDLLPEEISETIITVGDPGRVTMISRYFDRIDVKRQHREFITHTGWIGSTRISVLSTGIGTDNMDIVCNELDALVNIDLASRTVRPNFRTLKIIRVGTAGGLQPEIPVDSWVASTYGLGIDNLLHFYRFDQTESEKQMLQAFVTQTQIHHHLSYPYIAPAHMGLLKEFVKDFHQGITVSCPGFYGPQGRMLRLGLRNPDLVEKFSFFQLGPHRIANFEMETSALYALSRLFNHQALSLSLVVANRSRKEFSRHPEAAMDLLIRRVLETLSQADL